MADGFHIDEDGVAAYAGLVHRCADDALSVEAFADRNKSVAANGLGEGYLYPDVAAMHAEAYQRARHRMGLVTAALSGTGKGIDDSVALYRRTDSATESRLDATYPPTGSPTPEPDGEPPRYQGGSQYTQPRPDLTFTRRADVLPLLDAEPEVGDMEPKLSEVERSLDDFSNYVSAYYWITKLVTWICGFDLYDQAVKTFAGDWREWAKAAMRWQSCGAAYATIAENFAEYENLEPYWRGNAADAAQAYFGRLENAIFGERTYYDDFLFPNYKEVVEIVYNGNKVVTWAVQMIFDLVVTMGVSAVGQSPKAIKIITEVGSSGGDAVTAVRGALLVGETATVDLVNGEPACMVERLGLDQRPYRHPGVA